MNYDSIELSEQDIELISLVCLTLTLSAHQLSELVDINKIQNDVAYLTPNFLASLDDIQKQLLLDSRIF